MSPRPVVGSVGEELYEVVAPLAVNDELLGWALLVYCGALTTMYQEAADWGRDDLVLGRPGWAVLLDPETCPEKALPWLAQLVGVDLTGVIEPDDMRDRIKFQPARRRGTPLAMVEAVKGTLRSTKMVILRERWNRTSGFGNAQWAYIAVVVYERDLINATVTRNAAERAKDAGLLLDVLIEHGQDWQTLIDQNETWDDVIARFGDWRTTIDYAPLS